MSLFFKLLHKTKTLRIYTMKTLQIIAAATILAASTTASAWDMPFFGDNDNSN